MVSIHAFLVDLAVHLLCGFFERIIVLLASWTNFSILIITLVEMTKCYTLM
jgi:hypothetical protein